ncbi:MAG TPA: hypothetical protein VGN80_11580 [Devosiaceae bacterium]|jgi:uncharacterized protein YjiS (DUF1127 family)|nr:hypothetical protein [Devosiaceae bacterium]
MAYLLSSERPTAAARPVHPLRALFRWLGELRAERARRLALLSLLELDNSRLDDLGIDRQDLFDALHDRSRNTGEKLSQRRARSSSHWLGRP